MGGAPQVLVIFGAGATHDSVPRRYWKGAGLLTRRPPPLAADLFDSRYGGYLGSYARAAPLVGEIRNRVDAGAGVEDVLQDYVERTENQPLPNLASQVMAVRWYLRDVVRVSADQWVTKVQGVTNYAVFLNILVRWEQINGVSSLFTTFNYDTTFEGATALVTGYVPENILGYIVGSPTPVFKPHGSVDWLRDTNLAESEASIPSLIDRASELEFGAIAKETNPSSGRARVPALAIPTVSKSTFECPGYHEEAFIAAVAEVQAVLTVGWRGQERNFLDLLRERAPALKLVVSVSKDANAATETVGRMREVLDGSHYWPVGLEGFSDLVVNEGRLLQILDYLMEAGTPPDLS